MMSIKNIQTKFSNPMYANNEKQKSEQMRDLKEDVSDKVEPKELNFLQNSDKIKKALEQVADGLNEMVKVFNRKIDFIVHDDTNRTMVKVIDTETGKILREIPPEEILDLVAKMQEAFGIIFDVKV